MTGVVAGDAADNTSQMQAAQGLNVALHSKSKANNFGKFKDNVLDTYFHS